MSSNGNGVSNSDGRKRKAGEVLIPQTQRGPKAPRAISGSQASQNAVRDSVSDVAGRRATFERQQQEENALRNWADSPQGRDVPRFLSGVWSKSKDGYVLVHKMEGKTSTWKLLKHVKIQPNLSKEAPGLYLQKHGYEMEIRSDNVKPGSKVMPVIDYQELDFDQDDGTTFRDPASLCLLLQSSHRVGKYSKMDDVMEMIEYGLGNSIKQKRGGKKSDMAQDSTKSADTTAQGASKPMQDQQPKGADEAKFRRGLSLLSFNTKGKFWFDKKGSQHSKEMEDILDDLKGGECSILVVRNLRENKTLVHTYWKQRMEVAVAHGVWSYYKGAIGAEQGRLFNAWKDAPEKPIKHQLWMQYQHIRKDQSKMRKYASQAAKKSFGSPRELEIVQSLAVIYETMYENTLIDEYFGPRKYHDATVTENNNGYVVLHVDVKKLQLVMPPIGTDVKFGIKHVAWVDTSDPVDEPSDEPWDDDMLTQPQDEGSQELDKRRAKLSVNFKGHSIDRYTESDFVLSLDVFGRENQKLFPLGATVQVELLMGKNSIPAMRQLKAIGSVSRALKVKKANKGGGDPKSAFFLQDFLLGAGNPEFDDNLESVTQQNFKNMSAAEQNVFRDYINSLDLNGRQKKLFDAVFNGRKYLTQMQGPPGTGKTRTTTGLAVSFGLLGLKTALCAPTNVAVQACVDNVLGAMDALRVLEPKVDEKFKFIVIPNSANLKESLSKLGTIITAYDFLNDSKDKEGYLLNHIIRSFERRAKNRIGNWQQANKWLDCMDKMTMKREVSKENLQEFVELGILEMQPVFKDPAIKLIMSTSSNADILKDYGFKPMALVHDETGFAVEPETMIPLSLGARFNVLVGDHLQLKPIVRARHFNEEGQQRGMSLFERCYGHHSVPLIRLNVNYRMHPDIAELPGLLSYEWLGCDPSTLVESDAYKFFHDWYTHQDTNPMFTTPRKPEFGGKADPNDRVRWMNVKNGWASPKPGATSNRNFANINAANDFIISLLRHWQSNKSSAGIPELDGSNITVLSPYKDDCNEMNRQLRWAIEAEWGADQVNLPQVTVIDKIQGGENEIVILLFSPHHANFLGFLREWNRLNVAMTRAKSVLYIFGQYDELRSQLHHIVDMGCKELALLLLDYAQKGRIVDLSGYSAVLPANLREQHLDPSNWTHVQNACSPEHTKWNNSQLKSNQKWSGQNVQKLEKKLLNELRGLRTKAAKFQADFDAGVDFDTALEFILPQDAEEVVEAVANPSTPTGADTSVGDDTNLANQQVEDDADHDLQRALAESAQTAQPVLSQGNELGNNIQSNTGIEQGISNPMELDSINDNVEDPGTNTLDNAPEEQDVTADDAMDTDGDNLEDAMVSILVEEHLTEYQEMHHLPASNKMDEHARRWIIKRLERDNHTVPEYLYIPLDEDMMTEIAATEPVNKFEIADQQAHEFCQNHQRKKGLPVGEPYPVDIMNEVVGELAALIYPEHMPIWLLGHTAMDET